MGQDQIKGMLDRAIAVVATMALSYMVKKGWLGESDAAALVPALVLLPSLLWGWWNNRPKALVQSAASVPGTVVITTPALAAATPGEANIVSNTSSTSSLVASVAVATKVAEVPKKEPVK